MATELEESPFERKNCSDCAHLEGYISLWCTSAEAIEFRGTSIPGVNHCPFWKPDWKEIENKYKTAEYGFRAENTKNGGTAREKLVRFFKNLRLSN